MPRISKEQQGGGELESPAAFLSSGAALLNCALADYEDRGYKLGTVVNIVGDSSTGKTILALTSLAAAAADARFDEYRFIFDDAEAANSFDLQYLFGQSLADRIEPPDSDKDGPLPSDTVQVFRENVLAAVDAKRPFIYVLDSFDSLSSDEEVALAEASAKARAAGKELPKTYGMAKAKAQSETLRQVVRAIKDTGSVLLVISQTRANIDPMSYERSTVAGGRALEFYCSHRLWLHKAGSIKRASDKRELGVRALVKVKKNKVTGKRREVKLPIYYDLGVDDVGACIDFLLEEKHWAGDRSSMTAPEFGYGGKAAGKGGTVSGARLISDIEDGNLEGKLHGIVTAKWLAIEESLKLGRKRRFPS